ncbi:MAG: Trk system potassium transporter TrkA [Anaerolineaceae bacterium]|nr:MAG: Trk system potassium transporter TrkA [Anaerolineaceae bacterium]
MNIIIVGCGKVGVTLAEQLDQEGHNIIVVDNKSSAIDSVTNFMDVMGIVGSGASYHVLLEAGIENADLLIAVTGSDELNLLCCLIARKAGSCHTIARVRNPQYNDEIEFIKEEMGLSMTINPELETAVDMAALIKLPSAIDIDTFAKGKVELLKFQVPENSVLNNIKVMDLSSKLHSKVLVCIVEREDQIFIPSGSSLLYANDIISIVASHKNAIDFFQKVGILVNSIKNVMLIGGGTLTVYLAKILADSGIKVSIIEQNTERCEELSDLLPNAMIFNANATEKNVLQEEGVEDAEAFASLTNYDEENILLSLYAKKRSKAKVFTKITRMTYDDIVGELPLGIIINPKLVTADRILQHIRAMENSKGSNVETLYKLVDNKVEALEFYARSNAKLLGVPLEKLQIKPDILVSCINRKGRIIIPNGQDHIQVGDTVIIVTTIRGLNDLNDILQQ